jgi:lysophospholipase L1-like esterase
MPESKPIRFLSLGDSYTIGESVGQAERWPLQLADLVASAQGKDVEVEIIARTGWTTQDLWRGIQEKNPQGPYDLVSLLIGVNNEYRGGSIEDYREDFHFLLGKAIEYAGGDAKRVIVLSIPDWGMTPFAQHDSRPTSQISAEIDAFNAINKDEAEKAGTRYVDVTPSSREAPDNPELIASDGLHPSGKMYAIWAGLALPEALAIFEMK